MPFTVWTKGISTVGPALQCRAWCADVPLVIVDLEVKSGDFLYADETERGVVVIPHEKAEQVILMLPGFKDTDDLRVADVQAGMSVTDIIRRNP